MHLNYKLTEEKLSKLAELLSHNDLLYFDEENIHNNKTGVAIFLLYYSKYTKDTYLFNNGLSIITELFDSYNKKITYPVNISKFAWMLNHLSNTNIIDVLHNFFKLNAYLSFVIVDNLSLNIYDFLHGALGIVLYFLSSNNKKANKYVSDFIDEFEKKAMKTENNGLEWLSVLDYKTGTKGYNISMSHGIASIIAMLSKIYKRGINREKTKYLLEGAMNYLLQQKLPKDKFVSIFPNSALESMEQLRPSRLAWCYGDLGISVAIWHASQALGRKDWEEEAVNILLHSAKRRDLKENGVVDAGLCHDTVGIASVWDCYVTLEKHLNTSAEY